MVHLISVKVREFEECIRPTSRNPVEDEGATSGSTQVGSNQTYDIQRKDEIDGGEMKSGLSQKSEHGTMGSCGSRSQRRTTSDLLPVTEDETRHASSNAVGGDRMDYGPEADGITTDFGPDERWRIWKNVLALGFAFMLHFTAFWGASNLQSSINADEALGTFTLAAIYGSLLVSNIFLPAIVIKYLGCKWTTSISLIAYMPFIASQFYPRFYTMIPAGLAVGLGGGPLWCAKCTYLSVVAEAYSQIAGVASDVIVTRFFGVFFMFYQFSQVWGNLISSAVLSTPSPELYITNSTGVDPSAQENLTSISENICGANFNPSQSIPTENPNLVQPPMEKIHLIAGIYLACMIVACLIIAIFVDSLSRYKKKKSASGSGLSGARLLAVTMRQLGNSYQLLILPVTMFIGAEQAFLAADYTVSFVSCGWGIQNIGYVMICFGVCNAISALCTGSIVKLTGRIPVVIFAFIIHVALILILQFWTPTRKTLEMYFIIAGFWGLADAIWLVQINSFYGILFPGSEEASYSNFRLWEATGSVIAYACSPYLSTRIKMYLLLGLLIIGFIGYAIVEYLQRGNWNRNKRIIAAKKKFKLVTTTENNKLKSKSEINNCD